MVTPTVGEVPVAAEELNAEISDIIVGRGSRLVKRKCMNGPALRITSRMFAPATIPKNVSAMLCGRTGRCDHLGPKRMAGASKGISAHQIGWMRTFHADRRPTAQRKRASPMSTPSIRIPAFGAMAQRHRRWPILSCERPSRKARRHQFALWQRTRDEIL